MTGPDYKDYFIARREKYIDPKGEPKYAICYKRTDKDLNIWFEEDEMKEAFDNWVIPELPYYYNTRKFDGKLRKEYLEKEKDNDEKKQIPKIDKKIPHPARQSNGEQEDRRRKDKQDDDYWDRSNEQGLKEIWGNPELERWSPTYGRGSTLHEARDQRGPRDTREVRGPRDEERDPRDPRGPREHRDSRESRDSRDSRDSDYYETGARPRPQREKRRRDNSRGRYREEYRDSSWDNNKDRRYADRSNSRERRDGRDADRDSRPSYGRRGR